jgi:hypothetical protein
MSRERTAQVATVVILAGALALAAAARSGWRPATILRAASPATPQDTVYLALDAARDGDVRRNLSCFTGPMDSSLREIVKEKGERSLADYIRAFNASVKGVALQEPQFLSENEVRLRVEYVYSDRNESQIYYLNRTSGGWRIARQENSEGSQVVVPYGTRVE